jgi:hypothetical protein
MTFLANDCGPYFRGPFGIPGNTGENGGEQFMIYDNNLWFYFQNFIKFT